MIEFTKSYKTGDGQVFGSIEDAQVHELTAIIKGAGSNASEIVAKYLLDKKDVLIDVLTTTPNSKPKARTTHGGKKTRKVITDAATSVTTPAN